MPFHHTKAVADMTGEQRAQIGITSLSKTLQKAEDMLEGPEER